MTEANKNIVIVGAGMAGLTAAAYLTKQNYNVLLLDKNDNIGGLVNTFERNGFFFDTGPRAFVNSGMVKPILKDLNIDCEILNNEITIALQDQSVRIDSLDSIKEYKQILLKLFPQKADDIEKIISSIYKLSGHTKVLYAFDNPNFVDYKGDKKVVLKELVPWAFKFLNALRIFNQYSMPIETYLKSLTDHQPLIDILTQFFFRGTPAYFALGYFYVYLDYFYLKGGTGTLPKLLHKKITQEGGTIKLNTQIEEIIPAQSKVVDTRGNHYAYDYLIWAADLKTLYQKINPEGLDSSTAKKIEAQRQKVLCAKAAESVFILYVAVDRPPSFFQENGGAHMFYTPSKKGLGNTNRDAKIKLLENFEKKSKDEILAWLADFLNLNTFEVSVPALRDPSLAPKGQTGLMISCLFDYEIYDAINKAGWNEEFTKAMEDCIIKIFSQSIYKGFESDVLFKSSTSPLTINKMTGNSKGAIVGWSFETKAPVANRLKDLPRSVITPIPGIYQASQWAYAPAGVPIAMLTGWTATQKIIKSEKENKRKKPD